MPSQSINISTKRQKAVLIILDGFGVGKESPFNAIQNSKMPFYKNLVKAHPYSELLTHGPAVGLPDKIMGNSEVGHMTMGCGRVVFQDLVRINQAIKTKSFEKNPVLLKTAQAAKKRIHLMGLLSDGGVHSHLDHLLALLDFCQNQSIPDVSVHAFLDGRDTPQKSAEKYLKQLLAHDLFVKGKATLATMMGRYFPMDRDKRWDRIDSAYEALTGKISETKGSALEALENSYTNGKTDEFVEPILFSQKAAMKDDDAIIFFNFRADRARQISEKIFSHKNFIPSIFASMTEYDENIKSEIVFPRQSLIQIFPEILEAKGLKQFRIAETEKYAHVTFFFNGGREAPYRGEDRVLIPSPKDVPTYDLKPAMSAHRIADEAVRRINTNTYDFVLMNFANGDMVGHTGNYDATLKAMETLDECLNKVISAAQKNGYHVLLTADHGNAELMCDHDGQPHTRHTLNPVPALWIEPGSANSPKSAKGKLSDGTLADIMPSLCHIMGIDKPSEATGSDLIR